MKNNLRYGIRKHKLGAASVFLGTMIVVGMGQTKKLQHQTKRQLQ
uniref:Fibronectin-binding protein n=1 Tax=Staphylococcus aureus TaxID=1280 RepID=Q53681_STAAU|nr:fibronectin-binding protein [Staphylococcus aureus]